jgi:hypothetical protein
MRLPDFIIIGAAKSGTTSIYNYLRQHPGVFMSHLKEPDFFALQGDVCPPKRVNDLEAYIALFSGAGEDQKVGEASTLYLYSAKASKRIRETIPEAKLIAVLRDPSERAYSNFLYWRQMHCEKLTDFSRAVKEEPVRRSEGWMHNWRYVEKGFYYAQLRRYYDIFDPGQIQVYLYDELCDNPAGVMRDVFRFIGVDEGFRPDMSVRYKASRVPISALAGELMRKKNPLRMALHPLLPRGVRTRIREKLLMSRPGLSQAMRGELVDVYREDILKLQGLIGRDLSGWLRV